MGLITEAWSTRNGLARDPCWFVLSRVQRTAGPHLGSAANWPGGIHGRLGGSFLFPWAYWRPGSPYLTKLSGLPVFWSCYL